MPASIKAVARAGELGRFVHGSSLHLWAQLPTSRLRDIARVYRALGSQAV